ncbi:helix-turn-helix domain-containing protein [Jannaschia sp. R86511]|uniref:helix-turn-helix domain-containing protein n=1 Tax=Jannaschia sp. R86511 TaxID=3093853 RepID=UPI0036D21A58
MTTTDDIRHTIAEAAALLGKSRSTVRDMCTRHELHHHRTGRVRGIYFTPSDIELNLELQRRPVGPRERGGDRAPACAATPVGDTGAVTASARDRLVRLKVVGSRA